MADNGLSRLENGAQRADAIARAFRESATRAQALERAAERLLSENNEQGAGRDEVRGAIDGVVTTVEQTNATIQKLGRGQVEVSDLVTEVFRGLQSSATGLQELAASISSITKDTSVLATSAESNAATSSLSPVIGTTPTLQPSRNVRSSQTNL